MGCWGCSVPDSRLSTTGKLGKAVGNTLADLLHLALGLLPPSFHAAVLGTAQKQQSAQSLLRLFYNLSKMKAAIQAQTIAQL